MKWMKRLTALLLCLLMLASAPVSALNQTDASGDDVVVDETIPAAEPAEACEECGQTEGHTETCSQYVVPASGCTECGQTEGHAETCSQYVTPAPASCTECGQTEGHTEECSQYVDPNACTECKQAEGHAETCSLYEAPKDALSEVTGPKVGDKIWIKSGSNVYKTQSTANGHPLLWNYEVEIVNVITDETGAVVWYEFKFTSLGIGEILLHNYKYVHVENTSVDEPTETEPADENACNCGENAPENLADHADSCPRKQYIKTLFDGKTAEEIYAQWETYDEATQNDLLNMLQKWDDATWEELNNLVREASTEQIVDGMKFTSEIPVVISEADTEEVTRIEEMLPAVEEYCIRESFVYDISGEDLEGVEITVSGMIDTQKLNEYGRCFVDIYHLKDNGEIEILRGTVDWEGNVTFETDSFSTFYFMVQYYTNNGTYTLSMNSTASVATILESCGVPTGFTITNVTADSGTVKDSDGNDIPWVTISNPTKNTAKVKLAGTFSGLHKLTVTTNKGTHTIDVAVPEVFYYLDGTDWCMETTTDQFVLGTVDYGSRTTNATVIGVEDVTGGVVIYARPGMVLQFTNGWRWGPDEDHLYEAHTDYGGWCWFSGNSKNYLIIDKNITEVKTFTVQFSQKDFSEGRLQHGTTATVHVIPDYTPTLLENVDGIELKTVPVTLFNYDGNAWKNYYKGLGATELFEFKSASSGVPVTVESLTSSINYGGWTMGIFDDELDENGLPVLTDGYSVDLFSDQSIGTTAKQAYPNVNFQFVYDPNTGYYTYASQLNAAQFFESENTIKLYRENLSAADPGAAYQSNNAGFYPFVDVSKAFLNTAGSTGTGTLSTTGEADPADRNTYPSDTIVGSTETWLGKLDDGYAQYSGYLAKDLVSTYDESGTGTVDMHFGLKVQSQFYLPEGKQINGQDIEFSFTGDDDLWVFIDGKLVLDLGGGHGPMSGTINFTDGTVTAENRFGETSYYQLSGESGNRTGQTVTGLYSKEGYNWEADEMHTLSIFYLEKCSGHSNCYMRFNIPLIPSSNVNVSKKVENQAGEMLSVTPDTEYTFTFYAATDDDKNVDAGTTAFIPRANAPYTIVGTGAPTGIQYTDTNGQFKLKHGWTAMFANIEQFTEVYVVESEPLDGYTYVGSTVAVNNAEAQQYEFGSKTATKVVLKGSAVNFDFVNKIKTQPLTIEKQVVHGADGLIVPDQKFNFTLDFTNIIETGEGAIKANDSVNLTDGGTFQLGHNESVTIPRVPVNMTFTLKEANPDTTNNSFDAPAFSYVTCTTDATPNAFDTAYTWTMGDNAENKITVTNQQRFDLTITKTGISNSDHHDASGTQNEERQSTIYTIVGKIDGKVIVEMDVAICGDDSVTIKKLPVGTYTVEENVNWSWRYTPDDGANKTVTIPSNAEAQVAYTNQRNNIYWLSGDSYCENWWGGTNGAVTTRKASN